MVEGQNSKIAVSLFPISATAAYITAGVDTRGFRYAVGEFIMGAVGVGITTLKVQEADDNATWSDVTGLNFSSATQVDGSAASVPVGTDDSKVWACDINLTGRKRYLRWNATALGACVSCGIFHLYRSEGDVDSASERGYAQLLRV